MKQKNTVLGLAATVILGVPIGYYAFTDGDSIIDPKEKKEIVVVDSTTTKKYSNSFLVISDTHLHDEWTQDEIINRGNEADTGSDLWDITVPKFKEILSDSSKYPKPDYVILLGDLPWHAYPTDTEKLKSARKNTGIVLSELREVAQKANVPLIYAPGNNDSWSGDYRAFTAPNGETPFDQDSQGIKDWPVINSGTCDVDGTQACMADNSKARLGCYSVYPLGEKGGIRLIILNSVMFKDAGSSDRHLHYYGKPGEQAQDVQDQMAWFENQFTEGDTNDAILIGFHIPPGKDGHGGSEIWNTPLTYNGLQIKDAFLKIMNEQKDRIVGVLSSHTHLDGLRKMMHTDATTGNLEFSDLIVSVAAITPRNGNNPSMKLFTYDPNNNHEWMNFTTINHDYWPSKNVGTSWREGRLISFNNAFKGDTSIPITKRVASMDSISLLNAVTDIYKAGGNQARKSEVAVTIEVAPGN